MKATGRDTIGTRGGGQMADVYESLNLLAIPIRVRLLRLLELEELGVGELERVLQVPQSTVSRHLKLLRDAGWVQLRKDGTASLVALSDALDADARNLWELVKAQTDGDHADDGLRLAAVLAAREVDSRAFFGRVAGQWHQLRQELFGHGFMGAALAALLPRELVVADLGCGTGEALEALAPVVDRLIGVDREPAMLEAARRRLVGQPHVELRQGSLEEPPLEAGEIDVALIMLVLHHVQDPGAALAGAARALRAGGRVVVLDMVAHDRDEYRRTMGHAHLGFEEAQIRRWGREAGLELRSWRVLAPDPEASGPLLFLGVLG
jgi:ubiquinone/menaquinone biosynthesis C-methylase UbiE/DNA-binding transcriptional ArsR family regulator